MNAVNTECPSCETTFGDVPEVDLRDTATLDGGMSLLGGDVTCDRCGAEFEVYFYP